MVGVDTRGRLFVLELRTGREVWSWQTGAMCEGGVTLADVTGDAFPRRSSARTITTCTSWTCGEEREPGMDFWSALVVYGVTFLAGRFLVGKVRGRRTPVGWQLAAYDLGLRVEPSDHYLAKQIAGTYQGLEIDIHVEQRRTDPPTPRTCFSAHSTGLPRGLGIVPQGALGVLRQSIGLKDVETGDAVFDAMAYVSGPETEMVALLDHETRARVKHFLSQRKGKIEEGRVSFAVDSLLGGRSRIVGAVRVMADIARRLSLGGRPVPERLQANATGDPVVAGGDPGERPGQ